MLSKWCTQYVSKYGRPIIATELEKVNPHPNSQEGQCYRMFKTLNIALISHASKVMLKILHARLQHYANQELPDVLAVFRKERQARDQMPTFAG